MSPLSPSSSTTNEFESNDDSDWRKCEEEEEEKEEEELELDKDELKQCNFSKNMTKLTTVMNYNLRLMTRRR